jgi:hypothetical protein
VDLGDVLRAVIGLTLVGVAAFVDVDEWTDYLEFGRLFMFAFGLGLILWTP